MKREEVIAHRIQRLKIQRGCRQEVQRWPGVQPLGRKQGKRGEMDARPLLRTTGAIPQASHSTRGGLLEQDSEKGGLTYVTVLLTNRLDHVEQL